MDQKEKIAIIGAGTMGAGIAIQYAMHGYPVWLYSRTDSTLARAKKTVQACCLLLEAGELAAPEANGTLTENIYYTTDLTQAVDGAWYVVETIVEQPQAKQALYQQLDELLPPEVIIASNTSFMDIFQFLPQRRQPFGIIVHWFAPAHILPLVEVVKGPETAAAVVDRVMELHRECGKKTVYMDRYVPGFIVNRLQTVMTREVLYLLENGYCSAEAIDTAVKTSLMPRGMLLGLVQRMDFTGIDMVANGLRNKNCPPAPYPGEDCCLFSMVDEGNLGVKSGSGFYDYSDKEYEEVLYRRDLQLLKSVRLAEELMADPLHKTSE